MFAYEQVVTYGLVVLAPVIWTILAITLVVDLSAFILLIAWVIPRRLVTTSKEQTHSPILKWFVGCGVFLIYFMATVNYGSKHQSGIAALLMFITSIILFLAGMALSLSWLFFDRKKAEKGNFLLLASAMFITSFICFFSLSWIDPLH
jgi:hypothetical protein